jgi:hypothetical protein
VVVDAGVWLARVLVDVARLKRKTSLARLGVCPATRLSASLSKAIQLPSALITARETPPAAVKPEELVCETRIVLLLARS